MGREGGKVGKFFLRGRGGLSGDMAGGGFINFPVFVARGVSCRNPSFPRRNAQHRLRSFGVFFKGITLHWLTGSIGRSEIYLSLFFIT